ncbi:MAG: hypothetical protein CMM02_03095 [Rhodopirellula sp.]|jgi:hypothetical protein|nr:hypothetical protein [Rhodopirellula sp.]|tara:strand:- start:356 stop:571 length:216 start_codon:yes stop_codon:yes gene_type:complete
MRNEIDEHKNQMGWYDKKDVKWFDYDDEIAIRVEKSDYTDNKLLITVHLDGGESEVIEKLLVDFKELIGWE